MRPCSSQHRSVLSRQQVGPVATRLWRRFNEATGKPLQSRVVNQQDDENNVCKLTTKHASRRFEVSMLTGGAQDCLGLESGKQGYQMLAESFPAR